MAPKTAHLVSALVPFLAILAAPAQQRTDKEDVTKAFTIEVELGRLPPKSQDRTGTCWCYSTTSFLESELERLHGRPVDLSEMHTVFYTYLEKARRYVQLHGKTQFSEGGLCHDVLAIMRQYGAVPDAAYTGLQGDQTRHDHGELQVVLTAMLEKIAESRRPSDKWEDAVRGVLEAYLGPVPESVQVEGRIMLPQEYEAQVLKIPFADYRQLMSLQGQQYGERCELLVPDNWMRHQDYWNVPLQDFMANLDHALRSGFSVAVDIDVSEPRGRNDVWQLPGDLEKEGAVTEELRQEMFDTRQTTDDHLMHIVGLARHEDGRTFYVVKDSYGTRGNFGGHRMVSRNYLMAKALSFMVHRDGVATATREVFADAGGALRRPTLVNRGSRGAAGARVAKARVDVKQLYEACKYYKIKNGTWPTGLRDLTTPDERGDVYIEGIIADPWRNDYVLRSGTTGRIEVLSWGPDGKLGTDDDISSATLGRRK